MTTYGPIEVFRAGTFKPMNGPSVTFTESDLFEIATGYDGDRSPAPVVLGHPRTDAPAYGWIDGLVYDGGKLKATIRDAANEFVDMVRGGKYRKVSMSFFPPDASNNPNPGTWSVKHLGFLGAAAPAVSGLKPVSMCSAGNGVLTFEGAETGNLFDERLAFERERNEFTIDRLIDKGRVLPVFKDEILSFLDAVDCVATFEFADGESAKPRDWFMSFLARQPPAIHFGAVDLDDELSSGATTPLANVPYGYALDPQRTEMHKQAKMLAQSDQISFDEAIERIYGNFDD